MHHRCYRAEKGQSQYGTLFLFILCPFSIYFRPVPSTVPLWPTLLWEKKEEELPLKPLYCTSLKKLQPYTARAYIVTLKSGYQRKIETKRTCPDRIGLHLF